MFSFLRNVKIVSKILLGIGVFLLLQVVVGISSFVSFSTFEGLLSRFSNVYLPKTDYLDQADRDLIQLQVAERSLIGLNPGDEQFTGALKDHQENVQQSEERLGKYRELVELDEEKSVFEKYRSARADWMPVSQSVVDLCKQGSAESLAQAHAVSFGEGAVKFEKMRGFINELEDINLALAEKASVSSKAIGKKMVAQFFILILVAIAVTGFIAWLFTVIIAAPIRSVTDVMSYSQMNDDLTRRLSGTSEDEIGVLSKQFNMFVEKLAGIIRTISSGTTNISDSSSALDTTSLALASNIKDLTVQNNAVAESSGVASENIKKISGSVESITGSIGHFGTAVEELSSSIQEVSKNCQDELLIATDANRKSVQAQTRVGDLEKSAKEISKIIVVITNIADQTNLLALNATIEAASAGDAGRGFAVVANEVKMLAQQTSTATSEIKKIVEHIQQNTNESISDINQITETIQNVHQISQTIASAMEEQSATVNEIVRDIRRTRENASAVSANVGELAERLTGISDNIQGMYSTSSEMSQMADGLRVNASSLSTTSGDLETIVQRFNI